MSLLHDETGSPSSARYLTWLVILATLLLIFLDARDAVFTVAAEAWVLLGTIASGLILWAAGPRIAQHVGPTLAKGLDALGAAAKARNTKLPSRDDDERGPAQ